MRKIIHRYGIKIPIFYLYMMVNLVYQLGKEIVMMNQNVNQITMEMQELGRRKLINQSIYHPFFGNIGEVKNLINHKGIKYIIFQERSTTGPYGDKDQLRAIPVKLFYVHSKSGELRVNFGPQWITEAPVFSTADLDQKNEWVVAMLTEYYKNNTLWSGKIS